MMCLVLLCCASVWAQFAQRGGIEGFVLDNSGAAIVGANLTLTDLAQNQTRQGVTDGTGHYVFSDLAAGQYAVSVERQGFATTKSDAVAVNIGRNTRYDFKLKPGSVAQSITVASGTVTLDTGQANLSTNISERQI